MFINDLLANVHCSKNEVHSIISIMNLEVAQKNEKHERERKMARKRDKEIEAELVCIQTLHQLELSVSKIGNIARSYNVSREHIQGIIHQLRVKPLIVRELLSSKHLYEV